MEKKASGGTRLIEIVIPASIEILGENCFVGCGSLTSLTVESGSRLSRIEKQAFAGTALIELVIPGSVELHVFPLWESNDSL
jgi:hypothetical protein